MVCISNRNENHKQFTLLEGLELICQPGAVYELRCPKTKRDGTLSGYFTNLETLAYYAEYYSGVVPAVYLTINPVKPDLLARAKNRIQTRATATTADHEIVQRCRLLLDFDPTRPAGISSTNEEHAAALARTRECYSWLTDQGCPEAILADSGNGGHLLYGLDLPNDEPARQMVENFLKAIAARFSDAQVKVDVSVFNAARISKVYGTWACKGDSIPERPHRLSHIIEAPAELMPVPKDLLLSIGSPKPVAASTPERFDRTAMMAECRRLNTSSSSGDAVAWVEAFLDRHKIEVRQPKDDNGKWQRRWILERCPFCESEDAAAVITINDDGKIGFRCQHNRCSEPRKQWSDFRSHFEPDAARQPDQDHEADDKKAGSRLARLVELATSTCEIVFDDATEETLARIPERGWLPVESKAFRTWLVGSFKETTGQIVRSGDLSDAILNIVGSARAKRNTHHRVAAHGGCIYIDLCRDDGKAVRITSEGWSLIDKPPVVFVVKKDMAALPIPQPGGTVDELREFVNVTEADFNLYLGWLLDALKGRKPYSILAANGEQGSGKSTFSVITGELIDPCKEAKTKSLPDNRRDLAVMASNRHALLFDNISWLSEEMSDALCRLATGSGMVMRSLYTNGDEYVFGGSRPVLLNGIPEIGDRSDFLGRTVKITLQPIPEDKRRDEKTLLAHFTARRPHLLGALCSLLANGLKNEGRVVADRKPRMADTYLWMKACEMGSGRTLAEPFADNLKENIKGFALETTFGQSLVKFLRGSDGKQTAWTGTAHQLHEALRPCWESVCGYNVKEMGKYPGNARVLSGELNRLGASLRENGIVVERERKATGRGITIDARAYFQPSRN
jgi:hypothetical protein